MKFSVTKHISKDALRCHHLLPAHVTTAHKAVVAVPYRLGAPSKASTVPASSRAIQLAACSNDSVNIDADRCRQPDNDKQSRRIRCVTTITNRKPTNQPPTMLRSHSSHTCPSVSKPGTRSRRTLCTSHFITTHLAYPHLSGLRAGAGERVSQVDPPPVPPTQTPAFPPIEQPAGVLAGEGDPRSSCPARN